MTGSAQQAVASDLGKIIVGTAAAAAIGCASGVLNCGKKTTSRSTSSSRSTTASRAPQPWSAERQQRAAVQTALNDFGYPVGSADGVYGGKTRAGVSNYQAAMGFPVTGNLSPYEQQVLLGAHNSYQTGIHNSTYPGLFAAEGTQGLLRAQADPNYYNNRYRNQGQGYAGGTQPNYGAGTQPTYAAGTQPNYGGGAQQPPMVNTVGHGTTFTGEGAINPPANAPVQGIATGAGALAPLPQIGQVGQVAVSMQDHCDFAKLTTQTNGQQIMATNMTDPDQALSEQFCDARTFLMGRVQTILGVARATEDQLVEACGTVQTAMAPVTGTLGSKGPATVSAEASGISGTLGLSDPAAAAEYGEVCIGLGYRSNDADMALAGALMLVGAGRAPFAEMVGHHVRNGFGTSENPEAANAWYAAGLDALAGNQPPAVLPSQTIQRTAIIRAAVEAGSQQAALGSQAVVPVANQALPPLVLGGN
ncbi:peptidoglycan-binding domain-containing protein [Marinibacterium sp. SX1]|uniref:peptidoglycan-binding domain-containing protein n=1 Tax=Marinibacterium sp. SX1 TaxID=3388424 RepID=UPI003D16F7AE